jgi:hypothetical protein
MKMFLAVQKSNHRLRGQSAVLALLCLMIFVAIAGGLVDIYRLFAARNWLQNVAFEAATAGATQGIDWSSISDPNGVSLNSTTAVATAEQIVTAEMQTRGITVYTATVRVIPGARGGTVANFPPAQSRLIDSGSDWITNQPAVGVYIEMPVSWVMLDTIGIVSKSVHAFGAAGVAD